MHWSFGNVVLGEPPSGTHRKEVLYKLPTGEAIIEGRPELLVKPAMSLTSSPMLVYRSFLDIGVLILLRFNKSVHELTGVLNISFLGALVANRDKMDNFQHAVWIRIQARFFPTGRRRPAVNRDHAARLECMNPNLICSIFAPQLSAFK